MTKWHCKQYNLAPLIIYLNWACMRKTFAFKQQENPRGVWYVHTDAILVIKREIIAISKITKSLCFKFLRSLLLPTWNLGSPRRKKVNCTPDRYLRDTVHLEPLQLFYIVCFLPGFSNNLLRSAQAACCLKQCVHIWHVLVQRLGQVWLTVCYIACGVWEIPLKSTGSIKK